MSHSPFYILGAGLTGLIAAHAWPNADIIERSNDFATPHKALLRFRSDAVARLTGVEFRKVRVHKGIYFEGGLVKPDIQIANLYSQKVLRGRAVSDRSIWNIDPVDRYVAPDTFHEQLIEAASKRLFGGVDAANLDLGSESVVSTLPLDVMAKRFALATNTEFHRAGIRVSRWRVRGADVFQTIYFPHPETGLYRASITGDTLICESMMDYEGEPDDELQLFEILEAFGLKGSVDPIDTVEQRYGKIAPVDEQTRRGTLFDLTHLHKVYSLGRFATWRNILLDDVVQDIEVIKRLMKSGSAYDHRRAS